MVNDWLLRIGDGKNFNASSKFKIWGIKDNIQNNHFIKSAKPGDRLWFVIKGSGGKIVALASFTSIQKRDLNGPFFAVSRTDKELGWTDSESDEEKDDRTTKWDLEVHYSDLYNIGSCDIKTEITGPAAIREYKSNKCAVNLPHEYENIKKYCNITFEM